MIQGDIIFCGSPDDRADHAYNVWVNGVIPYEFDSNVSALNQQRAIDAMAEWEAVATVDFQPWALALHGFHRLDIRDSTGDEEPTNSSYVGCKEVGAQTVNIVSWESKFIIAHELGHALGYWHEQSRSDRGAYVQINWDRIIDGKDNNFETDGTGYGPYDFDSVMHYGQCAFSCCGADPDVACTSTSCGSDLDNCRTITVLPPYTTQWQGSIGQRNHLSYWDARVMSFMYPQEGWLFVDETYGGIAPQADFLRPWPSLVDAYFNTLPEQSTIWGLQPGEYSLGTNTLDRPMTIASGYGTVTLVP